ncbi:50S ribosomal protein L23 [Candidatus Bathyarchaeota archaeon]|nr:50S ribosomal protein L23 [Candidatus Bathyarchaeota archaeon]
MPIRFTKFDIRDYLYNLYDVEVKAVRSWVRRPTAPIKNDSGRFVRAPGEKYMTVEMVKPFVWPEVPHDLSPWDKQMHTMREHMMKEQERVREIRHKGNIPMVSEEKLGYDEKKYRTMAQELLLGHKKWSNGIMLDEKWSKMPRMNAKKAKKAVPVETIAESGGDGEKTLDK